SDLLYWGDDGVVVEVTGLTTRRAARRDFLGQRDERSAGWLYEVAWSAQPRATESKIPPGQWAVIDAGGEHPPLGPWIVGLQRSGFLIDEAALGLEDDPFIGKAYAGCLVVWGAEAIPRGLERIGERALAQLQAYARAGGDTKLVWLTRRAMGP